MIKKILKIGLISLIPFIFIACENNSQSTKKKEVKYTASLPMPKVKEEHINEYFKLSELSSAKKDPLSATKIGYAYSEKLKDYDKAIQWFKYSNSMKAMPKNSNYMCYAYQMKKEYEEAIKWCKNAIELGSDEALIGLGFSYSKLEDYENAVKWYLKASEKNHPDSMINLGSIYTKMKDNKNAEKWYKKAIEKEDLDAYQGISKLYHDNLNDNIKASAYAIAVINTKYTKRSVLKLLQKTWKIPNETIKKGYELQLNSDDFPIKYKGDLGLEK